MNEISKSKSRIKISTSRKIRIDFKPIPIATENPTNPSRYSFLIGLKKVRIMSPNDKNLTADLLKM